MSAPAAIDYVQQFKDDAVGRGLTLPAEIIADGKIHRFATKGNRQDKAGWYIFWAFDGIAAGACGDFRQCITYKWHARIDRRLTKDERASHRARMAEMCRQREAEEAKRQEEARQEAEALWNSAKAASDDHPYLKRKGVKSYGLAIDHKGRLLVPVTKAGELHSLQIIEPNGHKQFFPGGRVKGCYFVIGDTKHAREEKLLCTCEGYATGANIHEATGYTTIAAFSAGNLMSVTQWVHERLPDVRLILCADDDRGTNGNPGLTKATEAARAVGGLVAVPDFGADRPEGATDFNDLAINRGLEAVKSAIANAHSPTPENEAHQESDAAIAKNTNYDASIDDTAAEERAAIQEPTPYQTSREKLGAVSMFDIEPEAVEWLWHPRIPLGKVTLIDGDPGLGKSYVTLAIATAVSLGKGLPGELASQPGRVLLLSAEDGLGDTVRPRLDTMGADCRMITAISKGVTLDAAGCAEIHNILEIEKPRLVIIDTLFAYTGAKVDINKANETRDVMTRLSRLAEQHHCAILCIRHLTKGGRDKSIYRGIGSIDLTAACRSVLLVGADVNDRSRRAIVQIKNNLAPLADPVGYSLIDSTFAWTGASDLTADQILASEQDASDALPVDEAVEFLRVTLASGPTNQKDVKAAAKKAGIKERTLYRAKKRLDVHSHKLGFGDSWAWSLNGNGSGNQ